MALDLECLSCQARLRTDNALLGKTIRCPQCAALLYLASPEKPLPELCDMALGLEPTIVEPRPATPDPVPAPLIVETPFGGIS